LDNDHANSFADGGPFIAKLARDDLIDFFQNNPWAEEAYQIVIHGDRRKRSCIELSDEMTQYLIQHCKERNHRKMANNHLEG
jgi:hypothetical protein